MFCCVMAAQVSIAAEKSIPFKTDNYSVGGMLFKVIFLLVIISVIAYAVSYAIKRYYFKGMVNQMAGKSKIQLLEMKRISPQLTLYRIRYDTKEILLAQSANGLLVVSEDKLVQTDESDTTA